MNYVPSVKADSFVRRICLIALSLPFVFANLKILKAISGQVLLNKSDGLLKNEQKSS